MVVAQELLQTMGLRSFTPLVTACPGCGRTTSAFFRELAESIQAHLRASMLEWRERYEGVEDLKVAVMGCVVNGPGESKHANIGISLPGTGERPAAPVYIDGERAVTLRGPPASPATSAASWTTTSSRATRPAPAPELRGTGGRRR